MTSESSPSSTPAPTIEYGPTVTVQAIRASGSIMAVGWAFMCRDGDDREQQRGLGRELPVHGRLAMHFSKIIPAADGLHLQAKLVTRHHRPAEAGVFNARKIDELFFAV